MSTTRRTALALAGALVLLVLAVIAYLVLFRGTPADEVSLDAAADAAADPSSDANTSADATASTDATPGTGSTQSSDDAGSATDAASATTSTPDGIDGAWDVVPGDAASVDDGTFVGYRVKEELAGVGSTTATGRTPAVTGSLTIADGTVTAVDIEADLTQLASDAAFRDRALGRQGLELDQFPTATFTLTEPVALPVGADTGEPVEVDAVGELTLHGVTQTVTWPLQAQLVDQTIVVVGSLDIDMVDFDITPPSAQRVLSIDDAGIAELQLRLVRA